MELNPHNRGGMGTSRDAYDNQEKPSKEVSGSVPDKELRAIPCGIASLHAYSMDALIPGFYAWFGSVSYPHRWQ
jgi:hypothetical protein